MPNLTDTDRLGNYLRLDLGSDELAELAVSAASSMIRRILGQEITLVEDDTVQLDGSGGWAVVLPELPVVEVSSVKVAGQEVDGWYCNLRTGILRAPQYGRWLYGRGVIEVTYTHGYETVPDDLVLLATTLAARVYDQGLVSSENIGGVQTTYSTSAALDLSSGEQVLLAKYRPS